MSDVHRIKLPFHLELDHVNVFAMADADGWILIDAGFNTEASFAALEAGLASLGIRWDSIHTLLLTHCHPDHAGLAPRVLEKTGARLLMHEAESAMLEWFSDAVTHPHVLDERLLSWGTPPDLVENVSKAFGGVRLDFHGLKPTQTLAGGEWIGAFRTVWTPGHSPGHLCLYDPSTKLLISGDHVLGKITPHISWMKGANPLRDYLASLDLISKYDVEEIWPSHGDPFTGLAARTHQIAKHHTTRCEIIRRTFEEGAKTPHEIVKRIWDKGLSPFQYRFALFEVMAHAIYMRSEGWDGLAGYD